MDAALVIAGTSCVGRHLCRRLAELGISYQATSRTPQPGFLACDLLKPHVLGPVIESVRPRWIFACAAAPTDTSPHVPAAIHVTATVSLLRAVARHVPDAV